jgi:CheY-like chemotaxis protein/HPt (histidine-containing phosphotransfer) domain-containing protein
VEAEVQRLADGRAEVEVRVVDDGVGIAEADQERIFDAFVMVDPSHGRTVGGTGLGLAISRRLARAMGGEVGVESDPGRGSCFWLRLPLEVEPAKGTEPGPARCPFGRDATPAPAARVADAPGHDRRQGQAGAALAVLVVEDNETNRIVMEEMLRHLGHRVTLAGDGSLGVRMARETRYDVVLMDLSMPQMDGWTAARAIRAKGKSRRCRILAVTAHARPDDLDQAREAGMGGWLTKPLSAGDLMTALDQAAPGPGDGAEPGGSVPGHLLDAERLQDLQRIIGGGGLQRILAPFFDQVEAMLAALEDPATPLHTLAAASHSAAGAAAVVGATALREILAGLEAACGTGDRAAIDGARLALRRAWPPTRQGLTALLRQDAA